MKAKTKEASKNIFVVAPGVWGMKDVFVNMYVINNPAENNWWLVDTGIRWSGAKIKGMAELLFGVGSKPAAIILTHGHFDHVGSVKKLATEWDVPVYAHHLEIPYLTGVSSYPPADPTAGGGLLSDLSFIYPQGPINIAARVIPLPQGGAIPGLPEWQYFHTPGHAPGHISLFRESDRVLIAGDAIVTTKTESLLSTIFQLRKVSGPPRYLTSDWLSAAASVAFLANLEPEIIATGHGRPMRGADMRKSLHSLVNNFKQSSIPSAGRYTRQPALMDDSGVVHIPPKNINGSTAPTLKVLGVAAVVLLMMMLLKKSKKKNRKKRGSIAINNTSHNGKYEKPSYYEKYRINVKEKLNTLKHEVEEKSHDLKKKFKDEITKLNELSATAKKETDKLIHDAREKSHDVKKSVKNETNDLKKPVLDILDHLKFKIKKRW
jgi:glyoxylase-like metal-dependent hydrolase (beta-lactamase superfamily II)